MKAIGMFLLFLGIIFVIHGIYEQKYKTLKENVRIEYRFIPRTYYEEQLNDTPQVSTIFKRLFESDNWIDRNVTLSNPSIYQSNNEK